MHTSLGGALLVAGALLSVVAAALPVGAADNTPGPALDFKVKDIDGKPVELSHFQGKVLLVVNVASRCGNTPQYTALEATFNKYKGQGFSILGFPANDFAGQEPGTEAEIKTFCTSKYNVTFPMFSKVSVVKGEHQAPLYHYLTEKTGHQVEWNFGKFLINRSGEVVAWFPAKTSPSDPAVIAAIEKELAAARQ